MMYKEEYQRSSSTTPAGLNVIQSATDIQQDEERFLENNPQVARPEDQLVHPRPGYYMVNFLGHQFEEPIDGAIGPITARMRFQENMNLIDHQQLNHQSKERKGKLDHI